MTRRLRSAGLLVLGLAIVAALASPLMISIDRSTVKPLMSAENANAIPGHYLVVMREDASADHIALHQNWLTTLLAVSADSSKGKKNRIKHVYDLPEGVRGYAGEFDDDIVAQIRRSDQVAYVEQDQMVHALDFQTNAPWGLARISHRKRPTREHYSEYPYDHAAGSNVTVMVIDTGINIHHVDFEGRASWGATIPENDEDVDGNGHGSHCAGTIVGKRYGVAKNAKVVAVKVLGSNGSGSMSDVVKGVEWAIQSHRDRVKKNKHARSVANMSLGGGSSRTLNRAVDAAVGAGVHFAVAAGNDNRNACNYSPAGSQRAVTVGATTDEDKMAWFSNHGKCVDVFAPGKDITSVWIGSNVATNTISGTSMASPHVAGLLAYLLSVRPNHDYDGKELKDLVIKMSTKDVIKGLPKPGKKKPGDDPRWPFPWPPPGGDDGDDEGTTPNRLVFTGIKEDEVRPGPSPRPRPEPEEPVDPIDPVDPEDPEHPPQTAARRQDIADILEDADPLRVVVWARRTFNRARRMRLPSFF